jgi:hypothetical protein
MRHAGAWSVRFCLRGVNDKAELGDSVNKKTAEARRLNVYDYFEENVSKFFGEASTELHVGGIGP